MAQEMDDLEFLLPSELLTDDDLLTDFASGFGNSCGLSSDLSSPVESVTGATETGSDEDDFVSELTRKLANSSTRDSNLSYDHYTAKGLKLSGSPQSTLCGFKPGSRGSPNSDSRVCSPPEAKDALSWDLLYAAAEEVARMRMLEEAAAFYSTNLYPAHKHSPVAVTQQKPNPASGFYPNQAQTQCHLSYHQFQAAKFQQQMNHHQIMKNGGMGQGNLDYHLQNIMRDDGGGKAYGLSMSAWPTLQQSQHQPGPKPVFLSEIGPKKERVGTGVFMPRRFGSNPVESRKKPVHGLNMDAQVQPRNAGNFPTEYDDILKHRNSLMMAQQRRNFNLVNQEFRLPQEWTY